MEEQREREPSDFGKAQGEADEDDGDSDSSSTFSERHREDPPSIPPAKSSALSRTTSRKLERSETTASAALSNIH